MLKEELLHVMVIQEVQCYEKYLGLPIEVKREKGNTFQTIW